MATLVQRIGRDDSIPKEDRIHGHRWESMVWLYLENHITLAGITSAFNLTSSQQIEIDYFYDEYDSRNTTGKLNYLMAALASTTALQMGDITEAEFRIIMELPETSPTTTSTTTSTTTTTTTAP